MSPEATVNSGEPSGKSVAQHPVTADVKGTGSATPFQRLKTGSSSDAECCQPVSPSQDTEGGEHRDSASMLYMHTFRSCLSEGDAAGVEQSCSSSHLNQSGLQLAISAAQCCPYDIPNPQLCSEAAAQLGKGALGAQDCQAPAVLGQSKRLQHMVHQLSVDPLLSPNEEVICEVQPALRDVHAGFTTSQAAPTTTKRTSSHPACTDEGQTSGGMVHHAGVLDFALGEAMERVDLGRSSLPCGVELPGAGPMLSQETTSEALLRGDTCTSDCETMAGPSEPVEDPLSTPRNAHCTATTLTPVTESVHACEDGDTWTGSSVHITPPIAAVTPSKAAVKTQQRIFPGLSLSDASMQPGRQSLKPHALASIASTTSVPVAENEAIHVSQVLIGHQNPLFLSSPRGGSDSCTPAEHADATTHLPQNPLNRPTTYSSEPDSKTLVCEATMTASQPCTPADSLTGPSPSVRCASDHTSLTRSPDCPQQPVGVIVPQL